VTTESEVLDMHTITKQFFNPEKEITEDYTEVLTIKSMTVKDEHNLLVLHRYWKDADGELWSDFDDPSENLRRDFDTYRNRKGFLSPTEIYNIRRKKGMSLREFAEKLGLGVSTLSQIENNQRLQVKYQDTLFRFADDEPLSNINVPSNIPFSFNTSTTGDTGNSLIYNRNNALEYRTPDNQTYILPSIELEEAI